MVRSRGIAAMSGRLPSKWCANVHPRRSSVRRDPRQCIMYAVRAGAAERAQRVSEAGVIGCAVVAMVWWFVKLGT